MIMSDDQPATATQQRGEKTVSDEIIPAKLSNLCSSGEAGDNILNRGSSRRILIAFLEIRGGSKQFRPQIQPPLSSLFRCTVDLPRHLQQDHLDLENHARI
ncbi:unnamed protein product [Linum trigynum]|uniref:Uncharacterized protein n=1 Tax=Linum trigynum TaxID=586398 RepID=A0AAV2CG45_9ROSI